LTGRIKEIRRLKDLRKQDFSPTVLDFGPVVFYLARHFGFCYGVENAIEISYRALEENQGKRVFLLSQMIHNQEVNADLESRGISFIMDTEGNQFIDWDEIKPDDVVIIPAFGTTVEIEKLLKERGLEVQKYNTTCPFVEKVWKRAEKLGEQHYTVIVHGKPGHEETRATFSHSSRETPTIVVRDMKESMEVGNYIMGRVSAEVLMNRFAGKVSSMFDPSVHLSRVGVVNQTTMLASETQAIADYFRAVMVEKYGERNIRDHFADTRDTLCYATNDNQDATMQLLEKDADLAIVVGGYNSSNTSHIVELCAEKFPTYFINSETELTSESEIRHFDYSSKQKLVTRDYLPRKDITRIVLTSGASCPDTLVDRVLIRLLSFFPGAKSLESVLAD
jgi:4-hydroxy-3-methylbut-2-enyl diphosphate reductase